MGEPTLTAFLFARGDARRYLPVLASLRDAGVARIVAGGPGATALAALEHVEVCDARSFSELLAAATATDESYALLVGEPALVPPGVLERAVGMFEQDERLATVSFFSNAAASLSFPFHHQPFPLPLRGHNAGTLTAALRASSPVPGPVPIARAAGPAVAVSLSTVAALGPVDDPPDGSFACWLGELSSRARRRGLFTVLDAATYVLRADDLCDETERLAPSARDEAWLSERDPYLDALAVAESNDESSPLELAFNTARAKLVGVQVLVDGSSLGSLETGTQVGLLALAEALAQRDDVAGITLAIPGEVPGYARHLQHLPKVRFTPGPPADLRLLGRFDIGYRPIQPDASFDLASYRAVSRRLVVNVLDLIAYQIGVYHRAPEDWLAYRAGFVAGLAHLDAVTTISHDVKEQLAREQLPIEASRVFAVPYGTEHLTGAQPAVAPAALLGTDVLARPFLVCLGTNYSHKNRDLAVRAHNELVERGHDLDLVLVGPVVPYGSSRVDETMARRHHDGATVVAIPDVPSPERNWLLKHAAVLLYPTSAEGFGLVPFEAAAFGTPAVHVAFGPLREIGGQAPVTARDWRPSSWADAVEQLLVDPVLAQRQVEHMRTAGETYSWAGTAEALVAVFRDLLALPARRPAVS